MNKHILLLFGLIALFVSSCDLKEEYENENSEAVEFAGNWYYQLQLEDGTVLVDFDYSGDVMSSYNSSANLGNEVWFDDPGVLEFKSKFLVNGEVSSFTGVSPALNHYELGLPEVPEDKQFDGAQLIDTVAYGEVALLEGKILFDAATISADENKTITDSLYLKVQFNSVIFTYLINMEIENGDTTYIPERQDDFMSLEDYEIYVASGHRATGWEAYF